MGLLGSLFGRKKDEYTETERNFLLALMSLRLKRLAISQGHTGDDAEFIVDRVVNAEDLSGDRILSIPDTIVFKVVKDFISLMSFRVNLDRKMGIDVDFDANRKGVIERIEKHRNHLLGLDDVRDFPKTLDAYVYYRVLREITLVGGSDPASIGFTRDTVKLMTYLVKEAYRSNVDFDI